MNSFLLFQASATVILGAPLLSMAALGIPSVLGRPLSERAIARWVQISTFAGLVASLIALGWMLLLDQRHIAISLGNWAEIPGYQFSIKFVFDRLAVPFVILTFVLCGTIGSFAVKYMHREPGFNRFFVLYSFFVFGMVVTSLAGTIETLFTGWELVGLSSAFLVGFFHERLEPVRNGFRVWVVYRIADAALLIGAVILHHLVGHGDFDVLLGHGSWPAGRADVSTSQALAVGLLFLIAAAGKSAMIPFSGWLPRAMEGPTPSSAVFYGSLSVHLGAFLLLRISPVLDVTPWLGAAVVVIGLTTAVFSAFACRVQTDIKSALSFAALTQVGIIFVEIGLGFRYLALIHILGHACLRTLQFLRAPSLLYDYRVMENAIGTHIPHVKGPWERSIPLKRRGLFYRIAMERGYLDVLLTDYLVHPFLRVLRVCDAVEKRWTDALDGGPSRESEQYNPPEHALEELL